MVLVIRCSWPTERTKEMFKVAMQLPPIPDYINRKLLISSGTERGGESFDIYEFDSSRIDEATDYLFSRISAYYDVPGFKYELKRWMNEQEIMNRGAKLMSG